MPEAPLPALNRFADDVVLGFDRFRAPLTEAEIERRSPDSLKPAEFRNLCQWGYPYVFETFRFHMTLSGRAGPQESLSSARSNRQPVRARCCSGRCWWMR